MAWYSKYLAAFERPYQDVSNEIKKEIDGIAKIVIR